MLDNHEPKIPLISPFGKTSASDITSNPSKPKIQTFPPDKLSLAFDFAVQTLINSPPENIGYLLTSIYEQGKKHGKIINNKPMIEINSTRSTVEQTKSKDKTKAIKFASPLSVVQPSKLTTNTHLTNNNIPLAISDLPHKRKNRKFEESNNIEEILSTTVTFPVPISVVPSLDHYYGVLIRKIKVNGPKDIIAEVTVCGKVIQLGLFPTVEEAARAHDRALIRALGPSQCQHVLLNFPVSCLINFHSICL